MAARGHVRLRDRARAGQILARAVERDFVPRFAAREIRVQPGAVIEV